MSETNYTAPWREYLSENASPEVPLYTPEIAARVEETKANPGIVRERTLRQIRERIT